MAQTLRIGDTIASRYELIHALDGDADHATWLARDQQLGRTNVLKFVDAGRHVIRDARRSLRLTDPCIVTTYDADIHEDRVFIVMEHCKPPGTTDGHARSLAEQAARLSPIDAMARVAEIAKGVAVAHDEGLAHGNISPSRILLSRTEIHRPRLKLLGPFREPAEGDRRRLEESDTSALTQLLQDLIAPAAPTARSMPRALRKVVRRRYQSCRQLTFEIGTYLKRFGADRLDLLKRTRDRLLLVTAISVVIWPLFIWVIYDYQARYDPDQQRLLHLFVGIPMVAFCIFTGATTGLVIRRQGGPRVVALAAGAIAGIPLIPLLGTLIGGVVWLATVPAARALERTRQAPLPPLSSSPSRAGA